MERVSQEGKEAVIPRRSQSRTGGGSRARKRASQYKKKPVNTRRSQSIQEEASQCNKASIKRGKEQVIPRRSQSTLKAGSEESAARRLRKHCQTNSLNHLTLRAQSYNSREQPPRWTDRQTDRQTDKQTCFSELESHQSLSTQRNSGRPTYQGELTCIELKLHSGSKSFYHCTHPPILLNHGNASDYYLVCHITCMYSDTEWSNRTKRRFQNRRGYAHRSVDRRVNALSNALTVRNTQTLALSLFPCCTACRKSL